MLLTEDQRGYAIAKRTFYVQVIRKDLVDVHVFMGDDVNALDHLIDQHDKVRFIQYQVDLGESSSSWFDVDIDDIKRMKAMYVELWGPDISPPWHDIGWPPKKPSEIVWISDLRATATLTAEIDLEWKDHSQKTMNFEIQSSPDNVTWTVIGTSASGSPSFQATGLNPGTLYYFKVRGVSTGGTSSFSNVINRTTLTGIPIAPSGLTPSVISQTEIDVTWTDNSSDETGFEVGVSSDNSSWTTVTKAANTTSHSFTSLALPGHLYYFRVRAINSFGNSSYSTSTATTLETVPNTPSSLSGTVISATEIDLTWTP